MRLGVNKGYERNKEDRRCVSEMYTTKRNVSSFALQHIAVNIERFTQTNTTLTTFFQSDQVRKHKTMQSLHGETH